MYCKKCHSELPENANYCPQCGERVLSKPKEVKSKSSTAVKAVSPLGKKSNAYTFILVAVIAAFVIVVLILNSNKKDFEKENVNIESNALDISDEIKVLIKELSKNPESLTLNIEIGNKLFDAGRFNESVS